MCKKSTELKHPVLGAVAQVCLIYQKKRERKDMGMF